ARQSLAEGRGKQALELVSRARTGWSPPVWLEQRMLLLESWAHATVGDFEQAAETAVRAGPEASLGRAGALGQAPLSSGDGQGAARALAGAPAGNDEPIGTRLAAWLVDARLSYANGDQTRGRRSLEHALRLGEPEQFRLPFALERDWLRPVLHRD